MTVKTLIQQGRYYDSVRLMRVARGLSGQAGIEDVAVVMATEANKAILRQADLLTDEVNAAGANDLVIAVKGSPEALDPALVEAEKLLREREGETKQGEAGGSRRTRTLHAAQRAHPASNIAVISVSGRYAGAEAWEALHAGLHVLLFSDNVSLEDEIALKQYAARSGLLLMGPGAGTAIINGVGLGFANQVPRGPVGIVSAAGTGLQEVSSLLARYGTGVSQGLGTGGRDLNEAVGGLMMLAGLEALQEDDETQAIVMVSKPPAPAVAQKLLVAAGKSTKPTVICFLGADLAVPAGVPNIQAARTLQEAAYQSALNAGIALPPLAAALAAEARTQAGQAQAIASDQAPEQRHLRGLFSGGTLCYESQVIWNAMLPEPVSSNAPIRGGKHLPDSAVSQGNVALDLGEEEFTVGRLHPMIDNDLRVRRILQEAADPQVAVIVLDVVLGYGAHPDPASELGPAARKAQEIAHQAGRSLAVIASITGTAGDPQDYEKQVRGLESAGVTLCDCNAGAARLAGRILCSR